MDPVPWRQAWHDALYAAGLGFYVAAGGPAAHFTTATHGLSGRVLAEALVGLWMRDHDDPPAVVVDVGAGRGELASHLRASLDDSRCSTTPSGRVSPWPADAADARIVAVDVVDRPDGLDERIEWTRSPGGAALPDELVDLDDALVIAHEWLDVVPCDVAEVDGEGSLRYVLVDPATGAEALGDGLSMLDTVWVSEHWPADQPGERVEIGRSRDLAWRDLVRRVRSGTLVAVDYGHTRAARPRGGSLTAYAAGRQVRPVPDGSCDITAHVAMDSLDHDELRTQREVLRELGVLGRTPPIAQASGDPLGYLRALERAGVEAQLIGSHGFGAFWWAVKRVPSGGGAGQPGRLGPGGVAVP